PERAGRTNGSPWRKLHLRLQYRGGVVPELGEHAEGTDPELPEHQPAGYLAAAGTGGRATVAGHHRREFLESPSVVSRGERNDAGRRGSAYHWQLGVHRRE